MKTIIKMKLELKYFSPYFKIIRPEKLLLFQLSQNSSQNASKQTIPLTWTVVFIQRILALLFTYTIDPETYGIAIRTRKKKKKERKGEKKGERNGTKGGWFTFPLRPASFLDLATWNACTLYANYSSYSSRTVVAKLGNLCVFWYSRSPFISFFFSLRSPPPFRQLASPRY